MANSSGSLTQVQLQLQLQTVPLIITDVIAFKMSLATGIHLLFICINLVMLFTVCSKPSFRHTARYILFGHMLFNDTLHLSIALLLYTLGSLRLRMVRAVCAFVVIFSTTTFTNAPLNLAVMSLERYTAICYPLRHGELATPQRTRLAIGLVWLLGSINVLIDVCALILTDTSFSLSSTVCTIEQLQRASWQRDKFLALNVLLLVTVAIVLIFTYVAIMLVARSASADPESARRAMRTVLLHVFQLALSEMSFLFALVEKLIIYAPRNIYMELRFVNYVVLLLLPRCLSSLVYGLRDEAFRPLFRQHLICSNVKRAVHNLGERRAPPPKEGSSPYCNVM